MDEMIQAVADEYFVYHPCVDPLGNLHLYVPRKVINLCRSMSRPQV